MTPEFTAEELSQIEKGWPEKAFTKVSDMSLHAQLPPCRNGYDFDLQFKSNTPLPKNRKLFQLPPTQLKLVEQYIRVELSAGRIRPSKSPIAANLFFVPKQDSTTELRPCVDYRDLNAATIDDRYPMASLKNLIQQLAGGDYYAKLDLRKGYNSLRVKEGCEWKLAFKCHLGLFEPLVMPFGPKTAPAWFQRFISDKCQDFIEEGWLVNMLDDFAIKTVGSLDAHKGHIQRLLTRLEDLDLFVKATKCSFFAKEIPFLGFVVNKYGYRKQPGKLEAIRNWGEPKSARGKNIHGIGELLSTPEAKLAFETVKEMVTTEVVLMFPDLSKVFYLHFDSSDVGTGAVLQQMDKDHILRPLEFFSRKFNTAELNYSTPDKELLGLVLALKHWRPLLYGAEKEIQVYTDHKSLRDFSRTQLLKPRHARWALILEEYYGRMKIHWVPGRTNVVADMASRNPRSGLTTEDVEQRSKIKVLPESMFRGLDAEINDSNTQEHCGESTTVRAILSVDEEEDEEPDSRIQTHAQAHQKDLSGQKEVQQEVVKLCHDTGLAGHRGVKKTLELILRSYWWAGIRRDVKQHVAECDVCQHNKV
ncbi:hypothetical protein SeLEV6574_g07748 [Synchytrium endobioticum]|uniref:Reverse transcriptase domain-containing protein n=1 Tax=Synchytrium endobioticum TaxID=286115 RepID=A0A507CGL8_9FUNG|nr:hypothetical protein SeLEV6574_g07748 [Synchytrium endobioticum]